jgi:hypothetical protein
MLPRKGGCLARCGDGSSGSGCDCSSRVYPRPSVTVASVSTSDTVRQQVSAGSRVGQILGGTVTREPTGLDAETEVTIALWRHSVSASGDFIDRFKVGIETTGDEAGQGSFSFSVPVEFSSDELRSFWFTIRNTSSLDEDYTVHFDVLSIKI